MRCQPHANTAWTTRVFFETLPWFRMITRWLLRTRALCRLGWLIVAKDFAQLTRTWEYMRIFLIFGKSWLWNLENKPTISMVFVACCADGPIKRTPRTAGQSVIFRWRLINDCRLASAFRLLTNDVPAKERAALTRSLTVKGIAKFRCWPESPIRWAVAALFAVNKTERFHFTGLVLLTQPCL